MDLFSWPPVAALLDAAYRLVTGLSAAVDPIVGTAAGVVAIVILTVLVRALLLPVGISQVRAEYTRRRLAPQIAALQKKHGADREKLAEATMDLYRRERTSPFAGMLPLLAQIPVISLVYAVFTHPMIAGHANDLLGERAFGAPLGTSFVGLTGAGPVWPAMAVYLAVLALIAVVTTVSRRVLALPQPEGSTSPTGMLRALSFLPYVTVVFAAFVPLAAAVYILTSTTWTVAERWLLRRLLVPARTGTDGRTTPSTSH
ncbi:YidC/Oxa1 family membrane protein insertase [Leifsonia aquatica]|uniref:Membrane protein insertase YidC n=2 Tax=Leifsonia aquatica TaxID=144185 RepID=U2QE63_LEIAQ|nr:YidC/Oxa1 family membrane protein insertase [Leifsonia aquatica]ERK61160.1 membrane protein insertase, YidC/Oxa1 family [Leifsonia aquatica ATCC 14665]MBB2966193.1 YidC/Oxa1 family membrane protein insertase [Leifsonia aquatica]